MTDRNCNENTTQAQPRVKNKKYTQQEFIDRATKIHNGIYTYERVVYKNGSTKVCIFCKSCQDYFLQIPNAHVKGQGCNLCRFERSAKSKRRSNSEFVDLANKLHGAGRYDYSKVEYVSSSKRVIITCNVCHDEFLQLPCMHLQGQGCANCAGCKRSTTEEFITKAEKIYGKNSYDFSETVYIQAHTKVIIICKRHKERLLIKPNSFLTQKGGCRQCANESVSQKNRMSFARFKERAIEKHGSKYCYDEKSYTLSTIKMKIHCDVHGDFWQVGTDHINGHGCKCCGLDINGFGRSNFSAICNKSNNGQGTLYVVNCHKGSEAFIKIGITSQSIRQRLNNSFPYDYDILFHISGDGGYIYDLETKLHSLLKENRYQPKIEFGGHTECFTTIKPVERLLKELSSTDQLQLLA